MDGENRFPLWQPEADVVTITGYVVKVRIRNSIRKQISYNPQNSRREFKKRYSCTETEVRNSSLYLVKYILYADESTGGPVDETDLRKNLEVCHLSTIRNPNGRLSFLKVQPPYPLTN